MNSVSRTFLSSWPGVILGAICGVVATGPMSAAMALWHRCLPAAQKYPLPPREITAATLEKVGVPADAEQLSAATLVAHFGYGGMAGALYGLVTRSKVENPVGAGVVLGVVVWTLSYLGLLPALGILRSATEHPARRNWLMFGAHLVWGVCLCLLHRVLDDDSRRATPAMDERAMNAQDTPPRPRRRRPSRARPAKASR